MDKEDVAALNRARNTGGWSYLGAIIPLVGLILGIISLSNIASIEPPEDSKKAIRRIRGVRRLALGGIALSIGFMLLYGGATFFTITHNNKIAAQETKAKLEASIKSCKDEIYANNSKIFTLYGSYPAPTDSVIAGFDKTIDEKECTTNPTKAMAASDAAIQSGKTAASNRCLETARQDYNHTLEINAVSVTKDASGNNIYHMSSENLQRIEDSYTSKKNSCNIEFS
ncbi:MAG: hypothetical protein WBP22_02580 [Candidatus Saccharimonas sp.]